MCSAPASISRISGACGSSCSNASSGDTSRRKVFRVTSPTLTVSCDSGMNHIHPRGTEAKKIFPSKNDPINSSFHSKCV
jgi:hypothetical protein